MVEKDEKNIELLDKSIVFEGNNDNIQPLLVLNLVRGHVSAIHKF